MGGCSSKPQTAESEGLLDQPPTKQELDLLLNGLKAPYQGSQHTLKSLFSQHGRNGDEDEDAQTLHDLLLHTVDAQSLSNFENLRAGSADIALPETNNLQPHLCSSCAQSSPLSNFLPVCPSTQKTAEAWIKLEAPMPNLTQEYDEKCVKLEGAIANPAQYTVDKCAKLGVVISNSPDENPENCAELGSAISNMAGENLNTCAELGNAISNLAGENADKCTQSEGAISDNLEGENTDKCAQWEGAISGNLAGENTDACVKSGALISNSEGENADRCANLGAVISNSAGENAELQCGKLEAESPIRGASLEHTSDLDPIPESESGDREIKGLHVEPKFDFLKISEPNFSESMLVEAFNDMKASGAMETEPGEVQSLHEKAMECIKTEEAVEGKEGKHLDTSVEKAMDDELTENTMEAEEKQMLQLIEEAMQKESGASSLVPCEKAFECEKSQEKVERSMACQKAGEQAEKAMEVDEIAMGSERTRVQVDTVFDGEKENGQEPGKGDMNDKKAVCVMKVETEGGRTELQDDKKAGVQDRETGVQAERTEVQDEGVFHGEKAKTVCVEKAGTVQDGEKAELSIGVHDEKTGVQIEKEEVQDGRAFDDDDNEKAKAVYVEKSETRQEDDRAFDDEKAKAGCVGKVGTVQDGGKAELQHEIRAGMHDEETGVQSEKTRVQEQAIVKIKEQDEGEAEDNLSPSHVDQSYAFASESTCSSEHSIANVCPPLSRCTEQPIVASPCGPVFEPAPKENTIEAAGLENLEFKQKMLAAEENTIEVAVCVQFESDQKMLAYEENIVDAEYVKHIEKPESEEKKTEQIEKIEFGESSIEAVVAMHAELGDTFKALNKEQFIFTDSEQLLFIEKKHGKPEHADFPSDFQHSQAGVLDDNKNAKACGLLQSLVEAAIGVTAEDIYQVDEEKKDDKFVAEAECKTASEALMIQSLTDGDVRNTTEFPSQFVVKHGISSDDSDMRADIVVAGEDIVQRAHAFSQSSEKLELQDCGHNQAPIIELDLITSKRIEAEQSLQLQVYDPFTLHPPLAESSVHVSHSCPTIVDLGGVNNGLADANSSDFSNAEVSVNEVVESKPRQESLGEDLVKASDNLQEKESGMI